MKKEMINKVVTFVVKLVILIATTFFGASTATTEAINSNAITVNKENYAK